MRSQIAEGVTDDVSSTSVGCVMHMHSVRALIRCLSLPQGVVEGAPVAVKVYDLCHYGAAQAYQAEKLAYQGLADLQGDIIPRLVRCGLLQDSAAPLIVTSFEGDALPEKQRVPLRLHKRLRKALKALHLAGAAHGDVRWSNFLGNKGKVRLVDLAHTVLRASPAQKAFDDLRLNMML